MASELGHNPTCMLTYTSSSINVLFMLISQFLEICSFMFVFSLFIDIYLSHGFKVEKETWHVSYVVLNMKEGQGKASYHPSVSGLGSSPHFRA